MDLVVGASILIALCILIGGVLWLKEALVTGKQVYYTFLFPNVGALQVGDPVMVNGVTKGRVATLYLRNAEVAAVVHLDNDVRLTTSCRVVVQNVGLMGERGVGIQLADGATINPSQRRDTTFVVGGFDTGIAEAMGMMGSVLGKMEVLLSDVSSIMNTTVGDTSFIRLFHTVSRRLDTLTDQTERLVAKNGPLVDSGVANLAAASTQLKGLMDNNSGHLSTIMANGAAISTNALEVVARADSLSASIQAMVREIEAGRGPLGMMLKDEQFSQDLKRTVSTIDTLAEQVRHDGLKMRIKLGFGKSR
jgi:phospholipid/cholesterol/gamma-HCH transport system substrate-binding protein